MTAIEILDKSIKRAAKYGNWPSAHLPPVKEASASFLNGNTVEIAVTFDEPYLNAQSHLWFYDCIDQLIFSHDFAKAFWNGIPEIGIATDEFQTQLGKLGWQYHLQQMVLEEDPLSYLAKFLE